MGNEDGYDLDPDAMRKAIKLAKEMLNELSERSSEVPDLVAVDPPANEQVSIGCTSGGRGKTVMAAGSKYHEAFQGQASYLQQLVPRLETALKQYEAQEDAGAQEMRRHGEQM